MLIYLLLLCFSELCLSRHFDNPIINERLFEPGVAKYNGSYYAVGSAENDYSSVPIYLSTDLQNWEVKGYAFTPDNFPRWADNSNGINSPEIAILGKSNFRIYFRALNKFTNKHAIGVGVSANILGPYFPMDTPLENGSQDLSYPSLLNTNGTLYLIWADWNLGSIYGQKLRDDGLSFAPDTVPTFLMKSTLSWEGLVLEAPFPFVHEEYYYIFYSHYHGGCFLQGNGTGIARSDFALGPYEKSNEPILKPNSMLLAPEQPSIVKDLDNVEDLLFFQALKPGCAGPYLSITSLAWSDNGWPYVVDYPF